MALLDIDGLTVRLPAERAARPIVSDVHLRVEAGETVGLVGESGSGKSVTCRAVLGHLPAGATATGRVLVDGTDVLTATRSRVRALRSQEVAMVFQDPRAAVDPLRRVGDFVTEVLRTNLGYGRRRSEERARELLDAVGIADPVRAMRRWPHEFSGGMLQRVVIAAALAPSPRLLLADEATTALDVTTQAEVVALLKRLTAASGAGVVVVTHDLELAAAVCDRVYVMYAGEVVEARAVQELFAAPRHPYTAALLAATPRIDGARGAPQPIPGRPPSLDEALAGCPFAPRCPHSRPVCVDEYGGPVTPDRPTSTACIRADEVLPAPAAPPLEPLVRGAR